MLVECMSSFCIYIFNSFYCNGYILKKFFLPCIPHIYILKFFTGISGKILFSDKNTSIPMDQSIVVHHIVAPEISHGVAAVNAEGSFKLFRRPDVDDVIGRRHSDLTVNPSMAPKKQLMSFRGQFKIRAEGLLRPRSLADCTRKTPAQDIHVS